MCMCECCFHVKESCLMLICIIKSGHVCIYVHMYMQVCMYVYEYMDLGTYLYISIHVYLGVYMHEHERMEPKQ